MLNKKRFVVPALVLLLYLLPNGLSSTFPSWRSRPTEPIANISSPDASPDASPDVFEPTTAQLPEYYAETDVDGACSRFSPAYFDDFRAHSASYCSEESPAKLTCFHRFSSLDSSTDSFCYAQGAVLDVQLGKFHLDCDLRQLSQEEQDNGILPFDRLPAYWYETGPYNIFENAIDVSASTNTPAVNEIENGLKDERSNPQDTSQPTQAEPTPTPTPSIPPPKTLLLLKREGEGNPWHCLMEIFSTFMTFDILRMPSGLSQDQPPFFRDLNDSKDTQAIILDGRNDGPYFDLWRLFAHRKPLRLTDLVSDPAAVESLAPVNLIIPLAGSGNPLWKDDVLAGQCANSPNLNVFSHRVVDFYGAKSPSPRAQGQPIIVTFVWRREHRRLQNENTLFAELSRRNPHISVRMVDFAALPFGDQVRVAQESDILVGVHGAGLTHSMFLRQGTGAVVEILPSGFEHRGFRNIAGMRNLGYFRTHAKIIPQEKWNAGEVGEIVDSMQAVTGTAAEAKQKATQDESHSITTRRNREKLGRRDEWHVKDIEIEQDRFFEIVETAIKFMYTKGPWSLDVN
ncbi:hypothetical protein GGR51DRAFT_577751 [Nemania sp. FL0031]|nr:hypothetical protein GGR51DRAFT_577751 [Nemania sp. FL0031]